jgi:hypothetical protein
MEVRRGDFFRVGRHLVMCGDLEQGDARLLLSNLPHEPTLAWTDPPYDRRVARNFRRAAGLHDEPDLDHLLLELANALLLVKGPVYIEMGKNGLDSLNSALRATSPQDIATTTLTYERKTTLYVVQPSWDSIEYDHPIPEGDGWKPARSVMEKLHGGQIVFDPCMGKAGFGRIAHATGHDYVGMELQPQRVEVALRVLARLTKAPVDHLGNLIDS